MRSRRPRAAPGTLHKLLEEFHNSPRWTGLSAASRYAYELHGTLIRDKLGDIPVAEIRRRDILVLFNAIAKARGNSTANVFKSVVRSLMSFAVEMEYRDDNPVTEIRTLPMGEYKRFTEDEVNALVGKATPEMRRAIMLALYTGQRRGDLLASRWDHMENGGIVFIQQKTKAKVWVPLHAVLAEDMRSWPRTALTILTGPDGKPWMDEAFEYAWKVLRRAAGTNKQFHSFRKTAAAKLAEAGCSVHELSAITGHKSLGMVEHYTKEVEQRRLAQVAMDKLGNGSGTVVKLRAEK